MAAESPAAAIDREAEVCAWLIAHEGLKDADLERARRLHAESGEGTLTALLARLGLVSERDLALAWAKLLGLPLFALRDAPELPPAGIELSVRFLKQQHVVPLRHGQDGIALAIADPADPYPLQAVKLATRRGVDVLVGMRSEIDDLIERYYGEGRSAMGSIALNLDDPPADDGDVEHLRDLASEAPVIRLVNLIVQHAVEQRASDIHIEPFEHRLKVRYRIDGVLHDVEAPPARSTAAVISRVKIMARMNIAERRLPQDGRIQLRVQGKELDLRVSTVPTSFGESVVLRILDRESVAFDFQALGFTGPSRQPFLDAIERPHGIVLVTGPTGSGKTTTLYTALSRLNTSNVKIITVEDPVEYQLEGINQIQVKPQIGLHFADALRSIMRQDPDVIMVGEMRDLETCRIAIQAALTGHLVLSTLHTNSAAGGITRLLDMGVEDYLIGSTITGILAQRLVRQLDPETATAYDAPREVSEQFDLERHAAGRPVRLWRAGASAANPTGYRGRCAIAEFLPMTDSLRRMVMQHAGEKLIERQARSQGMTSMYDDGIAKAVAGVTTLEEVLRVTRDQ